MKCAFSFCLPAHTLRLEEICTLQILDNKHCTNLWLFGTFCQLTSQSKPNLWRGYQRIYICYRLWLDSWLMHVYPGCRSKQRSPVESFSIAKDDTTAIKNLGVHHFPLNSPIFQDPREKSRGGQSHHPSWKEECKLWYCLKIQDTDPLSPGMEVECIKKHMSSSLSQLFNPPPSVCKTWFGVWRDWVLGCLMMLMSQLFTCDHRNSLDDCHGPDNVCSTQRIPGICCTTEHIATICVWAAPSFPSGAGHEASVEASGRWSVALYYRWECGYLCCLDYSFFRPSTSNPRAVVDSTSGLGLSL